jgi:hypothetical protein
MAKGDMKEIKSAIGAQKGDAVELEMPEFDVVNDGAGIRATEIVKAQKTYNRAGILAKKAEIEKVLAHINTVIAEMDVAGVV